MLIRRGVSLTVYSTPVGWLVSGSLWNYLGYDDNSYPRNDLINCQFENVASKIFGVWCWWCIREYLDLRKLSDCKEKESECLNISGPIRAKSLRITDTIKEISFYNPSRYWQCQWQLLFLTHSFYILPVFLFLWDAPRLWDQYSQCLQTQGTLSLEYRSHVIDDIWKFLLYILLYSLPSYSYFYHISARMILTENTRRIKI